MNAINLYTYSCVEKEDCSEYATVLSNSDKKYKVKDYEFLSLKKFVERFTDCKKPLEILDGFFFGYTIKHISKEFDLLKLSYNKYVLNIELKSQMIKEEKIQKQLIQNAYYLEHIAERQYLFTYVADTDALYKLVDNEIVKCDFKELIDVMEELVEYEYNDIGPYFDAKKFLVSPLNMPDKFIEGKYFLTNQQKEIRNKILKSIEIGTDIFYGIQGAAGTGKTLLLYDLAVECSKYGKVCIIHCGILCDGHRVLNAKLKNIDIVAIKYFNIEKDYQYIFVDESQRIWAGNYAAVVKYSREKAVPCVFSHDYFQVLSKYERSQEVPKKLQQLEGYNENLYTLSKKIRTNEEINSFIECLLRLSSKPKVRRFPNVDVLYVGNVGDLYETMEYYVDVKKYHWIGYTPSTYVKSSLNKYTGELNSHQAIGQEFNNVIVMMDINFKYDEEGNLLGRIHPNPDYLLHKLFYQAVSRAREKLCIVVLENKELFRSISSIKNRYLSD